MKSNLTTIRDGYEAFDPQIIAIAKRKTDGDRFLQEELRSEMHMALPVMVGIVKEENLEKALALIAEAFLHGRINT